MNDKFIYFYERVFHFSLYQDSWKNLSRTEQESTDIEVDSTNVERNKEIFLSQS